MSSVQPASRGDQVEVSLGAIAERVHQHPRGPAGVAKLVAPARIQRLRAGVSAGPQAARVLVGDAHALALTGFRVLLEAGRRITVAGNAAAGVEAVALARRTRPREVRMDVPLPGLDGIEATGRMSAAAVVAMTLLTKTRVTALNEFVTSTTIANTARRASGASRARIAAEADETRRQIQRALHDGSQQRLVTLTLELQAIKSAVPSERPDLLAQLSHVEDGLRAALDELREIARGVHPSVLSIGGLRPALKSIARRSTLPVELELGPVHRLPEPVEVAVYYVVSEALANTVKHAHASIIHVEVTVVDHTLHLSVRDDGVGGADPTGGSGLLGLKDRVEILGGTITVQSPPGGGTSLRVELPLEKRSSRLARRSHSHRQVRHCARCG